MEEELHQVVRDQQHQAQSVEAEQTHTVGTPVESYTVGGKSQLQERRVTRHDRLRHVPLRERACSLDLYPRSTVLRIGDEQRVETPSV